MLRIDPEATAPAYEQLRDQLVDQVTRGELAAGVRLPTVRGLATELGLAPNTVARVYRELEQDGYVVTAGRRGTVVVDQDTDRAARGWAETRAHVARMHELGVNPGETMRLLRQVLAEDGPG